MLNSEESAAWCEVNEERVRLLAREQPYVNRQLSANGATPPEVGEVIEVLALLRWDSGGVATDGVEAG